MDNNNYNVDRKGKESSRRERDRDWAVPKNPTMTAAAAPPRGSGVQVHGVASNSTAATATDPARASAIPCFPSGNLNQNPSGRSSSNTSSNGTPRKLFGRHDPTAANSDSDDDDDQPTGRRPRPRTTAMTHEIPALTNLNLANYGSGNGRAMTHEIAALRNLNLADSGNGRVGNAMPVSATSAPAMAMARTRAGLNQATQGGQGGIPLGPNSRSHGTIAGQAPVPTVRLGESRGEPVAGQSLALAFRSRLRASRGQAVAGASASTFGTSRGDAIAGSSSRPGISSGSGGDSGNTGQMTTFNMDGGRSVTVDVSNVQVGRTRSMGDQVCEHNYLEQCEMARRAALAAREMERRRGRKSDEDW